jgi:GDP-D-mannose dehydratase
MGDSTKARKELSWSPEVTFEELAEMMAKADYERLSKLR